MLATNTVFVVGAGAGYDSGMPLGKDLASLIRKAADVRMDRQRDFVSGDGQLWQNILRHFRLEAQQYQRAGWMLRDGLLTVDSIDDFLERHGHDQRIVTYGKAAIARIILEHEHKSPMQWDRSKSRQFDLGPLSNHWLMRLFKIMARKRTPTTVDEFFNNTTFINFNYDRCLERFFTLALQPAFGLEERDALMLAQLCKILRPYGSIPSSIQYGGNSNDNDDYATLGKSIKTYSEQVEDQTSLKQIRDAVQSAETIVFLGFGFHEQNISLLTPDGGAPCRRMYATLFGEHTPNVIAIKNRLQSFLSIRARNDCAKCYPAIACNDLFDQYSRAIEGHDAFSLS